MMDQAREQAIPTLRLTQPLPPLPTSPLLLDELPHISIKETQPQDVVALPEPSSDAAPPPPDYTPMYDYLRSQQQQRHRPPLILQATNSPPICAEPVMVPYRDDPPPFIVQIDAAQPPPPSYHELYVQHDEDDMQRLIREFDDNGSPAEVSEEIFKWIVSMVLIALTVAGVGMAFNWGRPSCQYMDPRYC